jgi:hypothetical protein
MKAKKEYIILAIITAALVGYLVLKSTDRIHYAIPDLKKVDMKEISKVEIIRGNVTTVLTRKGDTWYITPQAWRVDPQKIVDMLNAIGDLRVTDLASETKAYDRYQLDAKNKVIIKAFSGNSLKREFDVGKPAPTNRHTFIMLPDDEKIYLAGGDFRRTFDTPAAELRDMLVLSLTPSEITEIHMEHLSRVLTLIRQDATPVKDTKPPGKDTSREVIWKNEKGEQIDKNKVETLLADLSKVYCEGYLDEMTKGSLTEPLFTIRLKGIKEYRLTIYGKTGEKIPAVSTGSESLFVLPSYKFEALQKSMVEIMGKTAKGSEQ